MCRCVGQGTSVLYGSRKDTDADDTVLELSGQDCLSQLVTTIC